MRGGTLYPLNQLRVVHPDLYEHESGKYVGREAVLEFRIPLLDVLWNDTLHLSPIHPRHLAAAWHAVGLTSLMWDRDFYEIPGERVAGHRCVWFASQAFWVNNSPHEDVPLAPPEDEFSLFDPTRYEQLAGPPAAYHAYLRRQQERGQRALQFPKIPHVLVAGPIDVTDLGLVRADGAIESS